MPTWSKDIFTIPNAITFSRLPLFAWFVIEAMQGNASFAFWLFIFIWALDWVDGFTARLFNQETTFGYYFDKFVDRFVMVAGVVTLLRYGILPPVTLLLMTRDVGYIPAAYPFRKLEKNWHSAGLLGKVTTLLQGVGFLWLYLDWSYPAVIVAATALIGGIVAFRHLRFVTAIVLLGIALPASAQAQVVMNELMWDGVEYIELFSSDTITLEGWKLTRQQTDAEEKTIMVFGENHQVYGNSYFLLEKNEEATTVSADALASALTLVNSGEVVRLYDAGGNVVDTAGDFGSWPAGENTETGVAMERVDGGWQTSSGNEGGRSGTPRSVNSSGESVGQPSPTSSEQDYKTEVVINEFLPNPTGADTVGEFIELYNPSGNAAELSGWKLDDASGGSSPYTLPDGTNISAKSYAVFYSEQTKIALNNTGDEVRLLNPSGATAASASYAHNVPEGQSYNREAGSYKLSTITTPGAANSIVQPAETVKAKATASASTKPTVTPTAKPTVAGTTNTQKSISVVIFRFLPDPVGSDDAEYIELKNIGATAADISGYQIDDEEGGSQPYNIPDGTKIAAGATAIFAREDTKIALNNTGDTVRLLSPDGAVVDSYTYEKVSEGEIIEVSSSNSASDTEVDTAASPSGKVAGSQTAGSEADDSEEASTQVRDDENSDAPQALAQLTSGSNTPNNTSDEADGKKTSRKNGIALGVVLLAGAGVAAATTFGDKATMLEWVKKVFVK